MRRTIAPVVVLCLVLAFLCACGHSEEAKRADKLTEQLSAVRRQVADIAKQQKDMQDDLKKLVDLASNNQATFDKSLQGIQADLTKSSNKVAELEVALTPPAPVEKKSLTGAGWSWFLRILAVLIVIGFFVFFFKRLTREDDAEDDLDSEFQEENDLGTVRYPGIQSPAPPESKLAKPGEGQSGKPS